MLTLKRKAILHIVNWKHPIAAIRPDAILTHILAPGSHAVTVTAESTTGQSSTAHTSLVVRDTAARTLDVAFIDTRTHRRVTMIDQRDVRFVRTRMQASDVCDPSPKVVGTLGVDAISGGVL